MKEWVIAILIIALIGLAVANVDKIEQALHPGQTQVAGMWIDNSEIEKYDFGGGMKAIDARINGDTYCKNCDKINPGYARICRYCGQYI